MSDREAIRDLIEKWVIYRDGGDWARFRGVFHDDGCMNATWWQAGADEFIEATRAAWNEGSPSCISWGGTAIDFAQTRALSQTRMSIAQRAEVEDVLCDVVCTGRFVDFREKRTGRGLVLRQPVCKRDRIDPVEPGARIEVDEKLLARFPKGYRHLAYLQTRIGYEVKDNMPGLSGPATDALHRHAAEWLAGGPAHAETGTID